MNAPEEYDIDLGNDHYLSWSYHDNKCIGALISHTKSTDRSSCWSHVFFNHPDAHHNKWTFNKNLDSPTFSPSLLCLTCQDHGFIENGKWRKA